MVSKEPQKTKNDNLKKNINELYDYLKRVLSINKTLSSTFMGVTLTAFIFLISLGYPDILYEEIIIGKLTIKVVLLSLSILVLSFFFFLSSTFIYHYCQLKLNSLYLFWPSDLSLSNRFDKIEKLYLDPYKIANFVLFFGVITLISAVIFIFFYFSTGGIILSILIFSIFGTGIGVLYLIINIKRLVKNRKKQNI